MSALHQLHVKPKWSFIWQIVAYAHCSKQYIGRTVQELRGRINGHRSWVNKPKVDQECDDEDEAALAEHLQAAHNLKSTDDFDTTYAFTVLQQCDPKKLADAEYKWISDMKTLTPFGLNIAKPYGLNENLI